MTLINLFHESPVFASIITLCYLVLVGIVIRMLIRMYRNKK